jgi:hypothetical protein
MPHFVAITYFSRCPLMARPTSSCFVVFESGGRGRRVRSGDNVAAGAAPLPASPPAGGGRFPPACRHPRTRQPAARLVRERAVNIARVEQRHPQLQRAADDADGRRLLGGRAVKGAEAHAAEAERRRLEALQSAHAGPRRRGVLRSQGAGRRRLGANWGKASASERVPAGELRRLACLPIGRTGTGGSAGAMAAVGCRGAACVWAATGVRDVMSDGCRAAPTAERVAGGGGGGGAAQRTGGSGGRLKPGGLSIAILTYSFRGLQLRRERCVICDRTREEEARQ